MNFYQALQKLLESNVKIRRDNWSDTTWIEGPASLRDIVTENHIFADRFPVGTSIDYPPTINVVDSIDEDLVERAYVPTQQDMLATNWEVIEHPESDMAGIYVSTHEIVKPNSIDLHFLEVIYGFNNLSINFSKVDILLPAYSTARSFNISIPTELWLSFQSDNRHLKFDHIKSNEMVYHYKGSYLIFSTQPIS